MLLFGFFGVLGSDPGFSKIAAISLLSRLLYLTLSLILSPGARRTARDAAQLVFRSLEARSASSTHVPAISSG